MAEDKIYDAQKIHITRKAMGAGMPERVNHAVSLRNAPAQVIIFHGVQVDTGFIEGNQINREDVNQSDRQSQQQQNDHVPHFATFQSRPDLT